MTYLALAYGFIWLAVFGYVARLGHRLSRLNREIEDLKRRVK